MLYQPFDKDCIESLDQLEEYFHLNQYLEFQSMNMECVGYLY